ncbi:hypothetical protein SEA_NEDARYA_1 [Gordonia phage Nedarya]|nr:hypothetical protein SEA_NEDARYA_1 [Gordonia phage Nedarya]
MFGTRTSQYWQSQPGKFDVLNLRATFESSNEHGIPDLQPTDFVPANLAAWNMPRHRDHAAATGGALHFFLDDYRFETVWSSPERLLPRVQSVGAALTPDFSLWRDMPRVAQIWNTYRTRWCGAYWQSHGIEVIPTACWSTPDTYDFCFDGLPVGGNIAISSMGIRSSGEDRELFRMGVEQLVARTSPANLIVYGKLRFCDDLDIPPVREFPTYWDRRRKQVQQWADEVPVEADQSADVEEPVELAQEPVQDLQEALLAEVRAAVADLDSLGTQAQAV